MECDVCGSHNVHRRMIEEHYLEECGLCGNLQGDDEAVALVEELRAGRARGLDDPIIPLVGALEQSGQFHVVQATASEEEPPQVLFTVPRGDAAPVERLLRTIEMTNRETKLLWLIELSLQHGLVYILRPRFWKRPRDVARDEIKPALLDLAVIARRLRRDLSLSWWRE